MSSFGGMPVNIISSKGDFFVTSCNKCLEGTPGFGIVICKTDCLLRCHGNSRSLSFDLVEQYKGLENNGQFRFTPPIHAFASLNQAIKELCEEGGVEGRNKRYAKNCFITCSLMESMGFKLLIKPAERSVIVTTFMNPTHPNFDFNVFWTKLEEMG
jgi:2-aminoethylphosphonate-pyruvate transaminase